MPGSPEKDVLKKTLFQAIGAEVDSRPCTTKLGIVTVAAPLARRVPVALLSLRAARLPVTSRLLLARLTGSWVSTALFRRCSMALFGKVFGLESRIDSSNTSVDQRAVHQPRSVAQELCLASCLMVLMASDVIADALPEVYASDSSLQKGAYCSAPVPAPVAKTTWLNGDRQGAYSRLDDFAASRRAHLCRRGLPFPYSRRVGAPVSFLMRPLSLDFVLGPRSTSPPHSTSMSWTLILLFGSTVS